MVRINPIEIVNTERRQKAIPGNSDLLICRLHRRERRPQFRILVGRCSLNFRKRGKRLGHLQVIHYRKILVEIGEDKHCQFQTIAVHLQFSFMQIALLFLELDLRLDHV